MAIHVYIMTAVKLREEAIETICSVLSQRTSNHGMRSQQTIPSAELSTEAKTRICAKVSHFNLDSGH